MKEFILKYPYVFVPLLVLAMVLVEWASRQYGPNDAEESDEP